MKSEIQNKEKLKKLILSNREQIVKFGTSRLGLFGSFVRDDQNNESDIDIVVEFTQGCKTYDNFINLAYFLEDLLDRKVELLTLESISPYIRPYIEREIEYVALAG